jgi:dsDNA-specific endonuclease/ATPase MutS2
MKTIEEIRKMKPEERSAEEQEALDAAERTTGNDFPKSWDEVFNHPRFKELNKRTKDAELEAERIRNEREQEKQEQLKKQGEWQKIAEENQRKLEAAQKDLTKIAEYEETLKETLDAQLKDVPEELRKLVPDTLDTRGQLSWLSKNKSILLKPQAFDIGAGNLNRNGPQKKKVELTPEQKAFAHQYGYSEDEYAKFSESGPDALIPEPKS